MAKKTVRLLHLGLHAPEARIIELMEEEGHMVSEVMRALIRQYGNEQYPRERAYAKAMLVRAEVAKEKVEGEKELEEMTNEDYATKVLRGKVVGDKVEFRMANTPPIKLNLATIKKLTIENNDVVKIHNELLDRTFKWFNGRTLDDNEYAEIWRGW